MKNTIEVRGAREHNLKNINVSIEKNAMTVITGLSGSGKSSLAFDTIYAEGQRRFIDSLSTYARNFLMQLSKPDVDAIDGLCPSIAIDQKTVSHSPRSTVGTVTEIYDYLRLLFAKAGTPLCPKHKIPVEGQTLDQILHSIYKNFPDGKLIILSPVAREKKGEFKKEVERWIKLGYLQAKIDGDWVYLETVQGLKKTLRHNIDIVVDKVVLRDDKQTRLRVSQALSNAIALSDGQVVIESKDGEQANFSTHFACPKCGYSYTEIDPLLFSFNNPKGACSTCNGIGTIDIEEYEVHDYQPDVGSTSHTEWRLNTDNPDFDWADTSACPDCKGSGLREEALNVYFQDQTIFDLTQMSTQKLLQQIESWQVDDEDEITGQILPELKARLEYLSKVGAGYLSLGRRTKTLSGGEAQRIRLASQVGAPLVGVLYVLDEPSIGLHPRDHHNVLMVLKEIKDRGNTIIVVEHDEDTIRSADHIIDIGPQAGRLGGQLIFSGSKEELLASTGLTADYLSGRREIPWPSHRRKGNGKDLVIKGACGNNLKNIDVAFPLGTLIGVTGVSGSGKSTLIIDTLFKSLANKFLKRSFLPSPCQKIEGIKNIDNIIEIDQKPIGRTPRSCPATYVGVFPLIRNLFAQLPESKIRGYQIGQFSFNVKGGRCESCQGAGIIRVGMQFLSDVFVTCEICQGKRYNPETLLVKYKGKNIHDVLAMNVGEAFDFFENHTAIRRKLETLMKVGLHYITLGQSSTTLSGGEAQRIKLSRELSKKIKGHTLYILDEPTTGLHIHDVAKLTELLGELVDRDNTVVVVEHNLDIIKSCDHLIDLGPDGGDQGGELLFSGSTDDILKCTQSVTGQYLKDIRSRPDGNTESLSHKKNRTKSSSLQP
ncbi:MAG: excinuclease ABC subunit UvrA [Bdellovibrionales bacterium]|nr:excinuclease ABC subunit UvrA [Bdellovibrionales bacterium]